MVVLASILPVRGAALTGDLALLTKLVIALLFFLHGAKLSRAAVVAGIVNWRLHLVILAATFALFPLLGLAAMRLPPWILPPTLAAGVLFLCCLPSTVQSSIAFTSVARGNVAAAICSASFSNLIGIVLTPLLVTLFIVNGNGGVSFESIRDIVLQLMVPFLAGQVLRRWIGGFINKHKKVLGYVDRGS